MMKQIRFFFPDSVYTKNMLHQGVDLNEVVARAIKYVVEGLAVAAAAYYIPRRRMGLDEISVIAMTSAATFAVLDLMAPSIGANARKGAGFGIGSSMVGGPTLSL